MTLLRARRGDSELAGFASQEAAAHWVATHSALFSVRADEAYVALGKAVVIVLGVLAWRCAVVVVAAPMHP